MSKAVLISIQPRFCGLIADGKKTIEIRKTKPKLQTPFKVYIYETKAYDTLFGYGKPEKLWVSGGRVIGEFVCDRIEKFTQSFFDEQEPQDTEEIAFYLDQFCISYSDLTKYVGLKDFYAWHITNLVIYDQPKELSEFWLYNEELHKRYESDEDYCAWGTSTTTESGCPTNDCEGTDLLQCYHCWEYWSGWCHKLKKAPQSWCYVEELDNENWRF